jgi:GDPmannose 4,6-dehydratase
MWLMMQQDKPDDYVVSSGEEHSVRDFCQNVANYLGINLVWSGEDLNEVAIDAKTGKVMIRVNKDFYRPAEVPTILGDSSKARDVLGWKQEYTFSQLVEEMCKYEMEMQTK